MNRIDKLFQTKSGRILSVYFTAGYPEINSTIPIIRALSDNGADMIEIGVPFSDPVADGPVIQHSSSAALKNGISLKKLLNQLKDVREITDVPLLMMSYLNPVLHYGMEKFCRDIHETGIDGTIIPDMPLEIYTKNYKHIFRGYGIKNIFLVTPQTAEERIRFIDVEGEGFLYVVSSQSTTGTKQVFPKKQMDYFKHLKDMQLKNRLLAGFGISNRVTFNQACRYLDGAIVGSAFIKVLENAPDIHTATHVFIRDLTGRS